MILCVSVFLLLVDVDGNIGWFSFLFLVRLFHHVNSLISRIEVPTKIERKKRKRKENFFDRESAYVYRA